MSSKLFDEEVGLFSTGIITGYDEETNSLKVRLDNSTVANNNVNIVDVPAPHSLFYNNGLFIGSRPSKNTPVVVGNGYGNSYFLVNPFIKDINAIPELKENELLIRSNDNTKISLDTSFNINIGSELDRIHINTKYKYISSNIDNAYSFSQAKRHINGVIKRDLVLNKTYDHNSKLEDDSYDSQFKEIGLDPTVTINPFSSNSTKNPPFVEDREIVYEFQYDADIKDDLSEQNIYSNSKQENIKYDLPDRRRSRADTLSLSLNAPNYLMETIKGTVVDIFGNILDINRIPLPIGKEKNTLSSDKIEDKVEAFKKIKELERKSVAFHFELNARKDLTASNGKQILPDISSNEDYARNRSRMFFDIDKEGQFKLNVPSSSEKGNVPLLTRYENYSSYGEEDNGNPNKLIKRDDNLDIFLDSFATSKFPYTDDLVERGVISLKDNDIEAGPKDRITNSHIKHGTAYHDILNTCYVHQSTDFMEYQNDTTIDIDSIPLLENVVSDKIVVSGDNANAGGRSGQANFDGSLELNIGANTVDRQSLWLDTAGGIVGNIGRDLNNKSMILGLDGDMIVQIGGNGVSGDSRFADQQNGYVGGALDIRVLRPGFQATMVRIDAEGVKIMTPGRMAFHANNDIVIKSDSNVTIEAESVIVQGRVVKKTFGGSI